MKLKSTTELSANELKSRRDIKSMGPWGTFDPMSVDIGLGRGELPKPGRALTWRHVHSAAHGREWGRGLDAEQSVDVADFFAMGSLSKMMLCDAVKRACDLGRTHKSRLNASSDVAWHAMALLAVSQSSIRMLAAHAESLREGASLYDMRQACLLQGLARMGSFAHTALGCFVVDCARKGLEENIKVAQKRMDGKVENGAWLDGARADRESFLIRTGISVKSRPSKKNALRM